MSKIIFALLGILLVGLMLPGEREAAQAPNTWKGIAHARETLKNEGVVCFDPELLLHTEATPTVPEKLLIECTSNRGFPAYEVFLVKGEVVSVTRK